MTAWDLHEKRKVAIRLPALGNRYSIVGDKLVIAPDTLQPRCPVCIWDLRSNYIRAIGSFFNLRLYHVDAAENVLVAFEFNLRKQPPEVRQTKWTTTGGRLLEERTFRLPLPADCPVNWADSLLPCSTYGHKTMLEVYFIEKYYTRIHLEYDYSTDRLSVRSICSADLFEKDTFIGAPIYLTPHLIYRWAWDAGQVAVYNAVTGTVTLHPIEGPESSSDPIVPKSRRSNLSFRPNIYDFGDREVLGLGNDTGIQLWFFNPKFAPDRIPDGKHAVIGNR